MKINRSDNPDLSLIGFWLRREVYQNAEFKNWVIQKFFEQPIQWVNKPKLTL